MSDAAMAMKGTARVVSIQTGAVGELPFRDRTIPSAFVKRPVNGPVRVDEGGLAGDAQADLEHHGGRDKAVCVYSSEHYRYWEERLQRELPRAAFGENLTIRGLTEDSVCIGDVFRVGTSVLQVSQPRQPCFKLAARHRIAQLALWVQETGYTGYYFRTLEPGTVSAAAAVDLVRRPNPGLTIAEGNRLMHRERQDRAGLRAALVPELSSNWGGTFERRLADVAEDDTLRLEGAQAHSRTDQS